MAVSKNSLFGFINLSDPNPPFWSPAFVPGVGDWQPAAPLSYLQNRFFSYKARSVNCVPDSTRFAVDLGQTQAVLCVVIPRHNLTLDATMRVRVFTDANMTTLASPDADMTVRVATQFPYGSLPFGDDRWFDGIISAESARFFPQPAMVLFPAPQFGRYVLVEIVDTENPAGYVELARLFVTPGYQPSINIAYGAQIGLNDETIVTRSLGGADFDDERPAHRTFVGSIPYLPQGEAFANIFMMQLRLGKKAKGQFFFSMFPSDPTLFALTSFVATLTKLDPLTAAAFNLQGVAFSIEEVVA